MFTAQQILVIVLALLVGVGTACAQMCDVSCSFQSKSQALAIASSNTASNHCHGETAVPSPQKEPYEDQQPAPDCPPHEFAGAWLKLSALATAATLQYFHHSPADLYLPFSAALEPDANKHARAKSYRAPPTPVAIFVLRI